jgi:DNA-binding transcriptional ArsR family regulator
MKETTNFDTDTLRQLADFFSAFADPTRLKIISTLMDQRELCVKDISAHVDVSESAISHQLKTLRLMRLIAARQEGRQVFYHLDDNHIEAILAAGISHIGESQ